MQEKHPENLDKILSEHTAKVFDLFQSRTKNFQTSFRLVLSFAILFLFIILIPFISIKQIHENTLVGQARLEDEIGKRNTLIQALQRVESGIQELHRNMEDGPVQLREFILNLPAGETVFGNLPPDHAQTALQMTPQQPQPMDRSAAIQTEIARRFSEYQSILQQDIYAPLHAIESDTLVVLDVANIAVGLDSLRATFAWKLAANPHFWHTVTGKSSFYLGLETDLDEFRRSYGASIEQQRMKLRNELSRLESSRQAMEKRLSDLQAQIATLDARLKQVEFPFGKLPIGLDESVAVFPIIVAIGFVIAAGFLRDAIVLRDNFHALYQRRDEAREIVTPAQIALIAPLWVDPLKSAKDNAWHYFLFLLPCFIFIASCVLILNTWTMSPTALFAGAFFRWLYFALYVVSALVFIYGFKGVRGAIRSYASK
ncbi:MAG: hypothetical protein ACOY90_21990 [Candidatus Zhuqueibacterota bacterium]